MDPQQPYGQYNGYGETPQSAAGPYPQPAQQPDYSGYYTGYTQQSFAPEGTPEWAQQRYPNVYNPRPDYIAFMEGAKGDHDYDKAAAFHKRPFSICTFLFSFFYLFYRKMWVEGALYIVIFMAVSLLPFAGIITDLVMYVAAGFAFYPLWRRRATRTWNNAVAAYQGHLPSVMAHVRQKGGTSAIALTVAIIVFVVYLSLATWMLISSGDAVSAISELAGTMNA